MDMRRSALLQGGALLACLWIGACGGSGESPGVRVLLDLSTPARAPFPSDRFSVPDPTQNTLRRVDLPRPDCALQPSECAETEVINQLDGFSVRPRITLPFSGAIDPTSIGSASVFLLRAGASQQIGITSIVWDPASRTLAFEPDEQLQEHTRYLLIVTDAVRDERGHAIRPASPVPDLTVASALYLRELEQALRASGAERSNVAAASLFTTQSVSADLVKIMRTIKHSAPSPADFMIADQGRRRALMPVEATTIELRAQTAVAPPAFTATALPMGALALIPGALGRIAYGKFTSPLYQNADLEIAATGTRSGRPRQLGTRELVFQLFIPAGARPGAGWPVALLGHGAGDSMYGAPWRLASVLASAGIASISINAVGHGGGPAGSLLVARAGATMTIPAGGRGTDQDGDGRIGDGDIGAVEGVGARGGRAVVFYRDSMRQTVIDLMQLVRQVQAGIDVEGDGRVDLDRRRIYYAGQSLGGIYGTVLLGVEPDISAGALNAAGGSLVDVMRTGSYRELLGDYLARRTPSLINAGEPGGIEFNENLPARGAPPLVNSVPGAFQIQQALDRLQWVQQSASPLAYAPYLRLRPLPGAAPKPILIQFARGDATVPNPTTVELVRAGRLADRTAEWRHDLARAADPALPANPHTFLTRIGNRATEPYALAAQRQLATFFDTGGAAIVDPDGAAPLWEVPSSLVPEPPPPASRARLAR